MPTSYCRFNTTRNIFWGTCGVALITTWSWISVADATFVLSQCQKTVRRLASNHNRRDETMMLANLRGTARIWFNSHKELTSWVVCKQKLPDLFSRSLGRQLAAREELAARAQSATESCVTYIQDVLALCHKVDRHAGGGQSRACV